MNLINTSFSDFLNEARSITKIQNEWSKVTAEMAAMAKEYSAAEGDAKTKILATLKDLTAKKKSLEKELDTAVAGKDKDVELAIKESKLNEGRRETGKVLTVWKKSGLTDLNVIAKVYADAMEDANFHSEMVTSKAIGAASKAGKLTGKVADLYSDISYAAGWNGSSIANGTAEYLKLIGQDEAAQKLLTVMSKFGLNEAALVSEGAVKQFETDYASMVKDIKSGYGWIDPDYVADTWENSSNTIDFSLVKAEIYNRLIKAGLLWYADEDGEEKGKQVKSLKELGIKESAITEGKITLKRQYTENHPAITAGTHARIRNRVLEAIKDGKITNEEFEAILKEFSTDAKRWLNRNAKYFSVTEDGVSLSKYGLKVFSSISVNEATKKNPEVWVPGGFDKEISKYPNSKITRDIVLKAAKKWDVDPTSAIAYVEFGWDIDLNENNNTTMKLFTSFSEFVNERLNNEETEYLVESFKSSKLSSLMDLKGSAYDKKSMQTIMGAVYKSLKVKLDEVTDDMIQELTPGEAYKSKAPGLYFYISDNEKPNPYHDSDKGYLRTIPGNRLLAVANGNNEIYNLEWAPRFTGEKGKVLKNAGKYGGDDSLGIEKKHAGYGSSGLSNVKRLAEVSDRVLYLNPEIMPSSVEDRKARAEAKAGATALIDPKKIKQENLSRYKELIAKKLLSKTDSIDKEVESIINAANKMLMDAFTKKQFTQYGELLVGLDPKGRDIKPQDVTNYTRNILDYYARYIQALNAAQTAQDDWEKKYQEKQVKEYTLTLREYMKKWDAKNPNIAW